MYINLDYVKHIDYNMKIDIFNLPFPAHSS